MPTGQQYSSNAILATLTAGISNSSTTCAVNSVSGFPATPFTAALDPGQANQELVDVTNVTGLTLTITRAVDGSTASSHSNNAQVMHAGIGRDFREARAHIDASSSNDSTGKSVHGLQASSSVVGTTDTQTLTNKTLTTPVVNGSGGLLTLPAGPDTLVGRATTDTLTNKTLTSPVTTAISNSGGIATDTLTATGAVTGLDFPVTGLTGATTASRIAGATAGGPPTTGTFAVGDTVVDTKWGINWICVTAGTPGTWQGSGMALFGETTLGSAGVFDWTPIPGYFRHLRVEVFGTSVATGGAGFDDVAVNVNNDAGGNYSYHFIYVENSTTVTAVTGSAVTAGRGGSVANGNLNPTSSNPAGAGFIEIPYYSYSSTIKNMTFQMHASSGVGAPNNYHYGSGGCIWHGAKSAITEVKLTTVLGTNFTAGSKASLYMIP